jgi:hydroxymethylglutaryl-CoA lyase
MRFPLPTGDLTLPDDATVVEMLPRDGFQNHDSFVPTDEKVAIVDDLSTTGVDEIEVTAFAHPKAVPNLRDADEVAARIDRRDDVVYRALVPNDVGMERAIDAEMDKVNALITVSETYAAENQNMTPAEILEEIRTIVGMASDHDVVVEAGIGTSFFCPYEGRIPREDTLDVVESVVDAGVDEITLATTMGMADPVQVADMLTAVYGRWPDIDCGLHLHDTNGLGLANTLAALECGVDRFDSSVCGLGGGVVLPEGLRGVGNTPTEDLVNALRSMGIETGVDFRRLVETAESVSHRPDIEPWSHVLMGGTPENVLSTVEVADQSGG